MSDFSTSVSAVQLQFDDSDSEKMALNVENMLRLWCHFHSRVCRGTVEHAEEEVHPCFPTQHHRSEPPKKIRMHSVM